MRSKILIACCIVATLLAINAIVFANTGPPGNADQAIFNSLRAGYQAIVGPANLQKIESIYSQAAYIDSVDNVNFLGLNTAMVNLVNRGRHVSSDSATNPAAERAAPSMYSTGNLLAMSENHSVIVPNFAASNTSVLSTVATGSLNSFAKESYTKKTDVNANLEDGTVGAFASNTLTTSANTGPPIKQIGSSGTYTASNVGPPSNLFEQVRKFVEKNFLLADADALAMNRMMNTVR